MRIPFRDATEIDELGSAAFLLFVGEAAGTAMAGGVLLVDARAEPLEFVHQRTTLPNDTLWSAADAWRLTGRRIAVELFRALGRTPGILLVRDDQGSESWVGDLEIGIPVGFIKQTNAGRLDGASWLNGVHPSASPAARLYERLAARDWPIEPFERLARAVGEFRQSGVGFEARSGRGSGNEAVHIAVADYLRSPGPLDWPHGFFDFQRVGIQTLAAHEGLLLADDMGLGKTVQAVAAIRILFHRSEIEDVLIVVPAGLIAQWQRAVREWAPELRVSTVHGSGADRAWQWTTPAHVFLTSYETLRSDLTDNPHSPPRRRIWGVVLFDEAQRIKNRETELARTCKRVPRQRTWALTGTPLENRIDDLASICELVTPWRDGEPAARFSPGPELVERHARIQLRRRKVDVLTDLPEKTVIDVSVQLTRAQRRTYLRAEREGVIRLRELGETVRITHVLELITRLKQICNFCPETGESAKLLDLEERMETLVAEGHRALVFSQYADDRFGARRIAAELQPFSPLAFTGAVAIEERHALLERFRREPQHLALVLSLKAGGQGLNLQEASYVFHFDRWWNPAWERQAEDRAHRLGQRLPVTVYRYLCEDTLEERIEEIIRAKQELFDTLVDGVSLDLQRLLTRAEIFGLFGLPDHR